MLQVGFPRVTNHDPVLRQGTLCWALGGEPTARRVQQAGVGGWAARTHGRAQRALPIPGTAGSTQAGQKPALGLERTEAERLEVKLEGVLKYSPCTLAVAVDFNC